MSELTSPYLQRKELNLAFFRWRFPEVAAFFTSYRMQDESVDIVSDAGDVNLLKAGEPVYVGNARAYAQQEVNVVMESKSADGPLLFQPPTTGRSFTYPRPFSHAISEMYGASPLRGGDYRGYHFDGTYPLVVFLGVGLGLHIEIMCETASVKHVVVLEHNMDRFAASLYVVDWETIFRPFDEDPQRSMRIVLPYLHGDAQGQIRAVQAELIPLTPLFPYGTLFYNHLSDPYYGELSKKLNDDIYLHLWTFGYFDDELNQINNARHNLRRGVAPAPLALPEALNRPWFIVGNGPSLDSRIDEIRACQGDAVIVSCGSAITALQAHGIRPDVHIELESDYSGFQQHQLVAEGSFLDDVLLIGPLQLTPRLFDLHKNAFFFLKNGATVEACFDGIKAPRIAGAYPTCTNAALAIALYWRVSEVVLYGMDFGYLTPEHHHSRASAYYSQDFLELGGQEYANEFNCEGVDGSVVGTNSLLFTAKRSIESLISVARKAGVSVEVFNRSLGAVIDCTEFVEGAIQDVLRKGAGTHQDQASGEKQKNEAGRVADQLDACRLEEVDSSVAHAALQRMSSDADDVVSAVRDHLLVNIRDVDSMVNVCFGVASLLETCRKEYNAAVYFALRGSVWHWLVLGFTHYCALNDEAQRSRFVDGWVAAFAANLMQMSAQLSALATTAPDFDDDPRVDLCVSQIVMEEIAPNLLWTDAGFSYDFQVGSFVPG